MAVLEIPTSAAAGAMELGRRHGARPSSTRRRRARCPDGLFAHVDYLTPNESELRILLGLPADDPRSSASWRASCAAAVCVTWWSPLGRSGALVLTDELDDGAGRAGRGGRYDRCGDAFNSGFAVALAEGRGIVEAVRFGVVCGGIACTRLGVVPGLPRPGRGRRAVCQSLETVWKDTTVNRNRLLNAELSHAIASMGHGDLMIVCDAGFPIPSSAWRIGLAIAPDVPDLVTVLTPIAEGFIAERVVLCRHAAGPQRAAAEEDRAPVRSGRRLRAGQARGDPRRDGCEGQGHRAHRRLRSMGQHPALFRRRRAGMVLQAGRGAPDYYAEDEGSRSQASSPSRPGETPAPTPTPALRAALPAGERNKWRSAGVRWCVSSPGGERCQGRSAGWGCCERAGEAGSGGDRSSP